MDFHRSMNMAEAYNATVDRLERTVGSSEEVNDYFIYKWDAGHANLYVGVGIDGDPETHGDVLEMYLSAANRIEGVGEADTWR